MPLMELPRCSGKHLQQGWGARLVRRTAYSGGWQGWILELTWGYRCRSFLLNGSKFFACFRNFRRLWVLRLRGDFKSWITPFFCVQYYRDYPCAEAQGYQQTGWIFGLGPARWLFDYQGGNKIYRKVWDLTTRKYKEE